MKVEGSASSAPGRWAPGSRSSPRSAATRRCLTTRPRGARARARAGRDGLAQGRERERWSEPKPRRPLERLRTAPNLDELDGCDLVIEAAPEDLELKRELFERLAAVCGPEPVLATNTSSLSVTEIAAGVRAARAGRRHALLQPAAADEAGRGRRRRESSAEAALAVAPRSRRGMGRTPIRAKDSPGFSPTAASARSRSSRCGCSARASPTHDADRPDRAASAAASGWARSS